MLVIPVIYRLSAVSLRAIRAAYFSGKCMSDGILTPTPVPTEVATTSISSMDTAMIPAGATSGPGGPAELSGTVPAVMNAAVANPPGISSFAVGSGNPYAGPQNIFMRNDPTTSVTMSEYNQFNTMNMMLFTVEDASGREQAVREVMQEADRRHFEAMEQFKSIAERRVLDTEAKAEQAIHNNRTVLEAQVTAAEFRMEANDNLLRSQLVSAQEELAQSKHQVQKLEVSTQEKIAQEKQKMMNLESTAKQQIAQSNQKVQNLEVSMAQLHSTLNSEYMANREATLQFLKTEFEESQQKLKADFALQEKQMQDQNDLLQDELMTAEIRLREYEDEDIKSLPKGNAEAPTGSVPASHVVPPVAPSGPQMPDPTVIPESFRGLFANIATAPTSVHASGMTTPVSNITGDIGRQQPATRTGQPLPIVNPEQSNKANLETLSALDLLKSGFLKGKPEDDKPKVKEAESIKLPDFPNPETYRSWKAATREAVRAASDQPDEAFLWLLETYNKDITHDKLRDPGKFLTLDTKLLAALTKVAKGELARQILNFKEAEAANLRAVRGRQVLFMFNQHFKTNEEVGSLYSVEDLLKVSLIQDDLGTTIHNWDSVIAGMSHMPDETTLRDILLRQIRKSQRLKFDLDKYERAKEGTSEHSYEFLVQSIRDLLARERIRKNRDRIAKSHGDKYGAPAGSDSRAHRTPSRPQRPRTGSAQRSRSPSRSPSRSSGRSSGGSKGSRSRSPSPKQVCRDFQRGRCTRGDACRFLHKAKSRPPKGSPKKINATCTFWKKGKCNQGDKCRFLHHDKPQSPGRKPDSPAAPETAAAAKDEKPRSPSPARRRPRSRGRSPNKDKPAACSHPNGCCRGRSRERRRLLGN